MGHTNSAASSTLPRLFCSLISSHVLPSTHRDRARVTSSANFAVLSGIPSSCSCDTFSCEKDAMLCQAFPGQAE